MSATKAICQLIPNVLLSSSILWSVITTTQADEERAFRSNWTEQESRRWIGPDWWANPLTDWKMEQGRVVAPAAKDRTLCLLTADLEDQGQSFTVSVDIEVLGPGQRRVEAAGFRIGRKGGIDDYRHALVHATTWFDATLRGDGRIVLAEAVSDEAIPLTRGAVTLKLSGKRMGETYALSLEATAANRNVTLKHFLASEQVQGGLSLLSNGTKQAGASSRSTQFAFSNVRLTGDAIELHPDRSFGPILWSQYTLNANRLRLQAQFAPLEPTHDSLAELWTAEDDNAAGWVKVAVAALDGLSRTVTFTLDDWDSSQSKRYEIRFQWRGENYAWDGRVRPEPSVDEAFKLACFSCDNGYLFPIPSMVSQVQDQNPDMLFFAGDQIYESYGGFGVKRSQDVELAMLDYLRKYYQFGWTWRELLRDRPSIILPDDHDVFQGNLWGQGGRRLPESGQPNTWALGGYLMPGPWIQAIEKTQVGHLPDAAADLDLPIGIKPYFTSLSYGGIGFAILEDRKFKTGPLSLPVEDRSDGAGANLLGQEQETFLERWANDWTRQSMKCALSQTIFCKAATHTGAALKRSRNYFDSGAWPKAARNRVVRILGDCNALSIHGDQHLGVLLKQGVDEHDDAGYAFMVPGTANGFPRAWWPGVSQGEPQPGQDFTGKFRDDAGHPIRVLAVGNPEPGSNRLPKSEDPMVLGYRKGSGYGMVEFDRKQKTAVISLYRVAGNEQMFDGFPQTIAIGGKP